MTPEIGTSDVGPCEIRPCDIRPWEIRLREAAALLRSKPVLLTPEVRPSGLRAWRIGHSRNRPAPRRQGIDRFRLARRRRPVCGRPRLLEIARGSHLTEGDGLLVAGSWAPQIQIDQRAFIVGVLDDGIGVVRREIEAAIATPRLGLKAQIVALWTSHRRRGSAARPAPERSRLLARRICWIWTRNSSAAGRAGLSGPMRSSTCSASASRPRL